MDDTNLIWIDLEMTGLDPQQDQIIEIATVVTNADLEVLAQGPVIAIHQPESIMAAMDEWNTRHHGDSGLSERVRQSDCDAATAEHETLEFLRRLMPELEAYFHYRNLDVSTLKELARLWKPELLSGFVKKGAHLALDDILESIDELRYYREHFVRV